MVLLATLPSWVSLSSTSADSQNGPRPVRSLRLLVDSGFSQSLSKLSTAQSLPFS